MPARQLTPEECRQRLYAHLSAMVVYWRDLPEEQLLSFKASGDVTHERLTGLLFSALAALDGSAMSLPAFLLVPDAAEDDEDQWPRAPINLDIEMHDEFPFDDIPKASGETDKPAG